MLSPSVSFIVPVYNAETKLDRCIRSIIDQSCDSWELILIDDGSTDNSGTICDNYANIDSRIRVIHKSNGGVSSARNTGLTVAKGEYISFVDADDYIKESFLEICLSGYGRDLIICGFEITCGTDINLKEDNIYLSKDSRASERIISNPYYLDTPWGKLFKKEKIIESKLLFDEKLKLSEDTLFCYQYLLNCKTVSVKADPLYFYDGIWGGDSKYKLSSDELVDTSKKITSALNQLSEKFSIKIDTRYKGFHLPKLKGLFTEYSDTDVYVMYSHSHPNITINTFLGNERLSPLTFGLLVAAKYAKRDGFNKVKAHIKDLNRFFTVPINTIEFDSSKTKIFYEIMKIFGPSICSILFYWKLKQ